MDSRPARQRLFSRIAIVAAGAGASVVVGVAREMIVASTYGASDVVDTYVSALQIATYLVSLVAGPAAIVFVPAYIQAEARDGSSAAALLFRRTLGAVLLVLFAFAAGATWFSPAVAAVVAPGFNADKRTMLASAVSYLAWGTIPSGASLLLSAVLNSHDRFVATSFSPIARNATFAALLMTLPHDRSPTTLATAAQLSFLAEFCFLAVAANRAGLPVVPHIPRRSADTTILLRRYPHVLASASIFSLSPLFDQAFASTQGGGAIASLAYGNRLVSVLLSITITALNTALLPHLSRLAAKQEQKGIVESLRIERRWTILVGSLAALAIAFTAQPIIAIAFQRGAFDEQATLRVASLHQIYALQIPFYVLASANLRALNALGVTAYHSMSAAALLLLSATANYLLVPRFGLTVIAWTTVGVYVLNSIGSGLYLRRHLSHAARHETSSDLIRS